MRISKWGNSLAFRLPADLVREMGLKEGDPMHLLRGADGTLQLLDQKAMDAYLDRLSLTDRPDEKFDRNTLYQEELDRRFPTIDDEAA